MAMRYVGIIALLLLVIFGVIYWKIARPSKQIIPVSVVAATSSMSQTAATTTPVEQKPMVTSSEQESHLGMKLYRNDEYGFEFWYPIGWDTFIHPYGQGASSKFEMVVAPNVAESNVNPFLVNIVEPRFADTTFIGDDVASSTVVINGVSGYEYRYDFEGSPEKAVVFSLGQYKVILGTTKDYMTTFDKILPTFKIIKK